MKEVYLLGLRDYVKSYYSLGPVWGTSGKATVSAVPKAATPVVPAPPPATLFSSDSPKPSSSQPKKRMSVVFNVIRSGGELTSGLRNVTDDMKTKYRANSSGVVPMAEKEPHVCSPAISKPGPPKLELRWVKSIKP